MRSGRGEGPPEMNVSFSAGPLAGSFASRLVDLDERRFAERFRRRDPSLWKEEEAHQDVVRNRLGWLDVAGTMEKEIDRLVRFAAEVKNDGIRHVLLLGMGGSSLCPEVLAATFGASDGYPDLAILDSTDPAAVAAAEEAVDLDETLIVVASKSGGTAEVDAFRRYFGEKVKDRRRFVAVTDPGSPLEKLAADEGYREIFRNPPDIGGRYSALSLFGLLPAALIGMDAGRLLDEGRKMAAACDAEESAAGHPGLSLGAFLAEGAIAGRDKMTLILSPGIGSFGSWVEQLVAESTGKEGKGVLPVDGESVAAPEEYGGDRLFVRIRCGNGGEAQEEMVAALETAGHSVVRIDLDDPYALGGEFFRWEWATAAASALLGVNSFDEPNVKESKKLTGELLAGYGKNGSLGDREPVASDGSMTMYADEALTAGAARITDPARLIHAHLERAAPGDYLGFLAYLPPTDRVRRLLETLRLSTIHRRRIASSLGFGPRFLHSTGQFFKGGPNRGVFFQITCDDDEDLPIPGLAHSFGILKQAQAMGDFRALELHRRRVLRCHLSGDLHDGLRRLIRFAGGPEPETRRPGRRR